MEMLIVDGSNKARSSKFTPFICIFSYRLPQSQVALQIEESMQKSKDFHKRSSALSVRFSDSERRSSEHNRVSLSESGKVSGKRPALAQAYVGIVFMTPYQPSASLFPAPPWRWCLVSQPLLQRSSFTYSFLFQALTFSGTS